MATNDGYIEQLYDAENKKQQAALKADYDKTMSDLNAEQAAGQRATDANMNRAFVESQQSEQAFNELQNAYGLSSGAMAQAKLARDTQLQDDMTALRAARQTADAEIERQRTLAGQQYTTAIQQAAAANDIERLKALYAEAKERDKQLTANKEAAGKLLAGAGDYSVLGELYGMTADQIAKLNGAAKPVAKSTGYAGSYAGTGGNTGSGSGKSDGSGSEESTTTVMPNAPRIDQSEAEAFSKDMKARGYTQIDAVNALVANGASNADARRMVSRIWDQASAGR